jgi:hypothetical protein
MRGKFFLGWLAVFVVWMAGSYVVHGILLHADYLGLPNLFRTEAEGQRYFPLMILAHVVMAGAFVWIYARGNEPKPWLAQGIRFGIAVALLTALPMYTIYYVVQPMPGALALRQMTFDGILIVILGVVAAFSYRHAPARPSA